MRSGGVEAYERIPRDLPTDYGFSSVELVHDLDQTHGRCESWGAGYWLGTEIEEDVLGAGLAPPDAGDVSGGYRNPTTSRSVEPNLPTDGGNLANRAGSRPRCQTRVNRDDVRPGYAPEHRQQSGCRH